MYCQQKNVKSVFYLLIDEGFCNNFVLNIWPVIDEKLESKTVPNPHRTEQDGIQDREYETRTQTKSKFSDLQRTGT